MRKFYVAVDFDGTCVTHMYPDVGMDVPYAVETLKKLSKVANIILWTMRSDKELDDAVAWFEKNEIPLFGVNGNPTQSNWTNSPKAYAQVYIDDAAFGCPLVRPENSRPYVDWLPIKIWVDSI